jgi:hypothetical protein
MGGWEWKNIGLDGGTCMYSGWARTQPGNKRVFFDERRTLELHTPMLAVPTQEHSTHTHGQLHTPVVNPPPSPAAGR